MSITLRALVLTALVSLPITASASTNYVFYVVKDIKWGTGQHKLAVPQTYQAPADIAPSAVASEAFHKLKSFRGGVYGEANLSLDPNFSATGAATVTLGKAAKAELAAVVSEVYWTLTAAGVKEVRIPEVGQESLDASQIPFGAATMIVQLWQVLPPNNPGPGYVSLGGSLVPAFEARQAIDKKDSKAVKALLALLESPHAYVKLEILKALPKLGLSKVDDKIIPLLSDGNSHVKRAAITFFSDTKNKKALSALETVAKSDPDASMQSAAARILSAAGKSEYAVIVLYDKLQDKDDGIVMDAIQQLAATGKKDVANALVNTLTHRNAQVQQMSMKSIIDLDNNAALRKVVETEAIAMKYRNQAAAKLASGTGEDAQRGLRHLIANGSTAEKVSSVEAVAKRRLFKLVADTVSALDDDEAAVRAAASKTLGEIKDSKGLAPLSAAIKKRGGDEAKGYEEAIVTIFGGLSVDEVIKFSANEDKTLRQLAIKSLEKFVGEGRPAPRVLEVLKKRLSDADKDIRRSAAFALARIKDAGVTTALFALKDDPDEVIREQVALSLTHSAHAQANATLLTYLVSDMKANVKRAAADGLRIRKVTAALQKLQFQANSRDVEVKRAVLRAITELAGPDDWEKFFKVWQKALYDPDSEVKIWSVKGLSARRDPRLPGLYEPLTRDADSRVKIAAIKALGSTGQPGAVEYIARGLTESTDKAVRMEALEALGTLNVEACKIPLRDFIKQETDKDLLRKANDVYDGLP